MDSFKGELLNMFNGGSLHLIEVPTKQVTVGDAISTYLFKTQVITLQAGGMAIIVPMHCQQNPRVNDYLQALIEADNPIKHVYFLMLTKVWKMVWPCMFKVASRP